MSSIVATTPVSFQAFQLLQTSPEANSNLPSNYGTINLKAIKNPNQILENFRIKDYLSKKEEKKDCDILLRKSGTENLLRLMVQSNNKENTDKIVRDLINIIEEINEN